MTTVIELLEIHHTIVVSPPSYPINSLALTCSLTSISNYVEMLLPNGRPKYIFLMPIHMARGYYSMKYFIQSKYSLIPSSHNFELPLKVGGNVTNFLSLTFVYRLFSEGIHSIKPLITLVSFAYYGDDSYVPLFINFFMTCVEFFCLKQSSDTFTSNEYYIYQQRLRRIWVFAVFPPLLSIYKKFVVFHKVLILINNIQLFRC